MSNSLELRAVTRVYGDGASALPVLTGVSLCIKPGEIVALVGPSGSGKSTLLQIAGLLDHPDGGEVLIDGEACGNLPDRRRTLIRLHKVGFVYQFHHLLPEFSALENIMMPQIIDGTSRAAATQIARELIEKVGLTERATHRPAELSGGEQQRVAIARSLANQPRILLADEPTGNLDPQTGEKVFRILETSARQSGVAALIATHNMELAARADRVIELASGTAISSDT